MNLSAKGRGEFELIYQFKNLNLGGTSVRPIGWDTGETFFLVIKDKVRIDFQDDRLILNAGEKSPLPKAMPHCLPCGTFINSYVDWI